MAALKEVALVSDLFMLSKAQMRRIEPYFPLSHGVGEYLRKRCSDVGNARNVDRIPRWVAIVR